MSRVTVVFPGDQARSFFRAYFYMLPGVLTMLLVARQLPLAIQEVGMAVALSGFVVAGAVKGLGLRAEISMFRLAVERFFAHLTDMAMVFGGLLVVGLIALGLGVAVAQVVPISHEGLAVPAFLILTGPLLYRFWPVLGLSYLLPDADAGQTEEAPLWDRLSFASAARLTRVYDTHGLTWLVLAACYASLLTLALIAGLPGEVALRPLLIGAFYLIFLPVTVFVAVFCGYQLWADAFGAPLPWAGPTPAALDARAAQLDEAPALPEPAALVEDEAPAGVSDPSGATDERSATPHSDEPADAGVSGDARPVFEPPAGDASSEHEADAVEADAGASDAVAEPVARPYAYVRLFPADIVPPRTPFEDGHEGACFVYLSNRNVCSYLFNPRPIDPPFLRALYGHFELGRATLYIVEKWFVARPEDAADGQGEELPSPPRSPGGAGGRYGVFRDPAQTPREEAVYVTDYQNPRNAAQTALDISRKHQVAVLAGRIVEVFNWD